MCALWLPVCVLSCWCMTVPHGLPPVLPILLGGITPPPLAAGDFITNSSNNKRTRVPRLVRIHSDELEDIPSAVSRGWVRGRGGQDPGVVVKGRGLGGGLLSVCLSLLHGPFGIVEGEIYCTLPLTPSAKGSRSCWRCPQSVRYRHHEWNPLSKGLKPGAGKLNMCV